MNKMSSDEYEKVYKDSVHHDSLNGTYLVEQGEELYDKKIELVEESKEQFFSRTKNELLQVIENMSTDYNITSLDDLEVKKINLLKVMKVQNDKGILGLLKHSKELYDYYEVILNKFDDLINLNIEERNYLKKEQKEKAEAMRNILFSRLEYYELKSIQDLLDIIPANESFLDINIRLMRTSKIELLEPELKELKEMRNNADLLKLITKSDEENVKIFLNELKQKTEIKSVEELFSKIKTLESSINTLGKDGKKVLQRQKQFIFDEYNEFKEQALKLNLDKCNNVPKIECSVLDNTNSQIKLDPFNCSFSSITPSEFKKEIDKPEQAQELQQEKEQELEQNDDYSQILLGLGQPHEYSVNFWKQLDEIYSIISFNDLEKIIKKTNETLKRINDPDKAKLNQSTLNELLAYSKISKDYNIPDRITKEQLLKDIEKNIGSTNLDDFLNMFRLEKIDIEFNRNFNHKELKDSEANIELFNKFYYIAKDLGFIDIEEEKKKLFKEMKDEGIEINEIDEGLKYYKEEIKKESKNDKKFEFQKTYALISYFKKQVKEYGI